MNIFSTQLNRRNLLRLTCVAGANAAWVQPSWGQITGMGDAINKAGRQRMLSQRMGKAWLGLGAGVDTVTGRRVLDQSIALFDKQLTELKAFAPTPDIRLTYTQLESEWSGYKSLLLSSTLAMPEAKPLLGQGNKVLALAHKGTGQLEQHSGKPGAKLVNMAGRQRMLSQRMAQYSLAGLWNVDVDTSQREMNKARDEFLPALEILRNAPEATAQIKQELVLADAQWFLFDSALKSRAGSTKAASDVFATSENLLTVMDRVTGMYDRILG
jgi:nitrate/nitrite-specific signal transduction histidine kinase